MYSQFLGSLGHVATTLAQGVDDVLLLEFLNRFFLGYEGFLLMEVAGKVFFMYVGSLAKDEGVFDDIFQFPDVAWIGIIHEDIHDLLGDAFDFLHYLLVELSDEVFDKEGYVRPALF